MPPSPPRRLNLMDGMILTAGFAACCLQTRFYAENVFPRFNTTVLRFDMAGLASRSSGLGAAAPRRAATLLPFCWAVAEAVKFATLWLATFSPIVLWLRLRRPRPDRRRLFLQPGAVATLIPTLVTAAGVALWVFASALAEVPPGLFVYRLGFTRFLAYSGPAIALTWTCIALAGRWRAERGPVERAGRLLGVAWIAAALLLAWSDFEGRILLDSTLDAWKYHLTDIIIELNR